MKCGRAYRPAGARRRRGTAVVEFAVTIPLLGLVLLGTFFFGWSLTNQQHVRASARYVAWCAGRGIATPSLQELDSAFYYGKAGMQDPRFNLITEGPTDTLFDYVDAAMEVSKPAGDLADEAVISQWPHGAATTAAVEFSTNLEAFKRFKGAIYQHYAREGTEWRRAQVSNTEAVRSVFLDPLDSTLTSLPGPAVGLGNAIRRLYITRW